MIAGRHAEPRMAVDDPASLLAMEMSASSPHTSPAPTATPRIALTTGLLQLIRL